MAQTCSAHTSCYCRNQVELVYNNFSQLAQDYQSHSGAVDTGSTPVASYSYANGSANTVRQTGITYPDGISMVITYNSAAAGALSRPDGLATTPGPSQFCTYAYLGMNVFVSAVYNQAAGVEWTTKTGGTGAAGDQYTALDMF